ncbi:adenylate/guanylate cyclase domain-containing protein [Mycolicibacterium llatzerense]|uniref:adenylate/guanylate cyclase domain-containing protein n=1 Tax=Mycolicibacterium llatzerense TaxID=280871 RepID=UPI0021B599CB|nr:adenylate/guanylate cyclase domain-containing protein [Mycolicibacterium llatzerense]MCT7363768.1 hypothetical protein [Mycolicibacterium llatzerense]
MDALSVRCWVQQRHAQLHMRKWMLEFDDEDSEREFRAHDDANGLRAATFAQLVGIVFTAVYAVVDLLVLHGFVAGALIVRAATIGFFLLGIVVIRRVRMLQEHLQIGTVALLTIVQVLLGPVLASVADFPTQYLMTSATVTLLGAVGLLRLRMHAALANTAVFIAVAVALPCVRGSLDELGMLVPQIAGLAAISLLVAYALERLRRIDFLRQREVEQERARTEEILYNVLPAPIADRLRDGALTIADSAPSVSVLFSDIVGFTPLSETLTPEALVQLLDTMFRAFDELCDRRGIEKIKTVGDAYMAVAGLPNPDADHAASMAELALDMQRTVTRLSSSWPSPISMRIGISSGPVVAGVIGQRKFIYDLWGDTVNTASRMESSGRPHQIQVSESTHGLLAHRYEFSDPQVVDVKGKGPMTTYFLEGAR